jgi:hypothetical protein
VKNETTDASCGQQIVSAARSVIMESNLKNWLLRTWQARPNSTDGHPCTRDAIPRRLFSWVRSDPWNWAGLTRQQATQKQPCCRSAVCEEATVTCFSHGSVHRREDKHSAESNLPINSKQCNHPLLVRHWHEIPALLCTIATIVASFLELCIPTSCSTSNIKRHSIDIVP